MSADELTSHAVKIPDQIDLLTRTEDGVKCDVWEFEFDVAAVWSAGLAAGLDLVEHKHALVAFTASDGTQYTVMLCRDALVMDGCSRRPTHVGEAMMSFAPVFRSELPDYTMHPLQLFGKGTHIMFIREKWTGRLHSAAVLSVFITALRSVIYDVAAEAA